MGGGYPKVRYGTVYGRILGEDTVRYGRNLKLRLRSIPRQNSRAAKDPALVLLKVNCGYDNSGSRNG